MSLATFNWDLAEDDIALPIKLVQSPHSLAFKLRQRFRFFLGEWFLNTLEGVPYYRDILIKTPDLSVARSIFRQVLLTTQDIASVRRINLKVDAANRTMHCDFIAVLEDGTVFDTSKLDVPFIITV